MVKTEMRGESGLPVDVELFVHAWIANGFKVREAYLETWPGVTPVTAGANGNAKLKEPLVSAYASGVLKHHLEKYEVTEDNILEELANIAFFDIKHLVDEDGSVIENLNDIPEKARRVISGITQDAENKVTVKLCNKEKALEMLAKYKRMLTELREISTDRDLAAAIMASRDRVGGKKTTVVTTEELLE